MAGIKNNSGLIDGKYTIKDLVDMKELRKIFESFSLATKSTIGFVSYPEQEILIATGWRDICTEFHRKSPEAGKSCLKSNISMTSKLKKVGDLNIEPCDNGLVDAGTPIIIKGKHVATLATGQVFLKEPDIGRFKLQAKKFGFNEGKYLKAVREVPVVSVEQFKNTTKFLGEIALMVAELGYANLEMKEKGLCLEKEILERKVAEERFRTVADFTYDWEYWQGKDKNVLYMSPSCERISGYRKEEFVKDPVLLERIIFKEDKDRVLDLINRKFNSQEVLKFDFRIVHRNGKIIWMGHVCQPIYNKKGEFLGRRASNRDISEQKSAEEALQKVRENLEIRVQKRTQELAWVNVNLQEEVEKHRRTEKEVGLLEKRIEFILSATRTGLDIIDSNLNMVYIDPGWAKVYGDYRGKKCYEYFMGSDKACSNCGVKKALETKKKVVVEEVLVKEGNRPIEVITIPFQDELGNWLVAEVNIDISERKKRSA